MKKVMVMSYYILYLYSTQKKIYWLYFIRFIDLNELEAGDQVNPSIAACGFCHSFKSNEVQYSIKALFFLFGLLC